jgi:hypothetical protein
MMLSALAPFRAWLPREKIYALLQSQPVTGDATALDDILHDLVDEALRGFQDVAEMCDCCSKARSGCATHGMPSPRPLEPVSAIG